MRSVFLSTVATILLLGCGGREESGQKAIDQIWKRLDANLASNLVNEASVCIKQASSITEPKPKIVWHPATNDIPVAFSLSRWPPASGPVLMLLGGDAPYLLVPNNVILFPLRYWKVDVLVKPGGHFSDASTNGIARRFSDEIVFRAWRRTD